VQGANLNTPPGYIEASQEAVYYPLPQPGLLKITGPDRVDFLQRQTTNDLEELTEGNAQVSVLVSPLARILDVFHIYIEGEALNVITLPGFAAATTQFLKSRIFFMDQVSVENTSEAFIQVDLAGPEALGLLHKLGWDRTPSINEIVPVKYQQNTIFAIGRRGFFNEAGFRLLIPSEASENLLKTMQQRGAVELTPEVYEILCVEAGQPSAGRELSDNFTPLEVGLEWAISAQKGCYTGQEVIARQITYDKVTQTLVGLRLEAPVQPDTKLWKDEKPAGIVTSTADSPTYHHIALGIVKRPFHTPGTTLSIGSKMEDKIITATVIRLPFHDDL